MPLLINIQHKTAEACLGLPQMLMERVGGTAMGIMQKGSMTGNSALIQRQIYLTFLKNETNQQFKWQF